MTRAPHPIRTPWLRFPLVAFLLALLVVLILGDHGPEWLLAAMDDEEGEEA